MNGADWEGSGTLVTGATGFVGGWLAEELVRRGARVITLVRDRDPRVEDIHPVLWEKAIVVPGDVTDLPLLRRIIAEYEIDSVFHLAAQAAVGAGVSDPVGTMHSNVAGTWSILEACRVVGGVQRIIVASSDKAYGEQKDLPYREDTSPLLGTYPYDASKAAADIIARSYANAYDLPIAVTRNANTYGGGDMDLRRIIPGTVQAVLNGQQPVIRSDGSPERDYLFVGDAVDGYLDLAAALQRDEIRGEAFNFGSGVPISVLEVVETILRLMEADFDPQVRGTASNELSRQFVAVDKAERLIGWRCKHTLEDGLRQTIDWYVSHGSLGRSWRGATR